MSEQVNGVPWEAIIERMDAIGVTLTEGAKSAIEFTYPLAVREVVAIGVFNAVIALVGIALVFAGWRVAITLNGRLADRHHEDEGGPLVLAGAATIFASFGIGDVAFDAIRFLINPQWHALIKLTELVK